MQWKGRRGGVSPPRVASQKRRGGRTLPVRCQSRQHKKKKNRNMRAHLCARCPCLRVAVVAVVMLRVRVVGDGVRRWGMCSGRGGEVGGSGRKTWVSTFQVQHARDFFTCMLNLKPKSSTFVLSSPPTPHTLPIADYAHKVHDNGNA